MKITVSPSLLCDLLGGHFTLEACEAICEYCEEAGDRDFAPMIGDIAISFSEIPASWAEEEDEDAIIATLDNGNVVIIQ